MKTSNFNLYSYATIAQANVKIYQIDKDGKIVRNVRQFIKERPTFDSPRPCFGFIWGEVGNDIRTMDKYIVDYDTVIYINRNIKWAEESSRKNFCALTDAEIDIYLQFVADVAGEKFKISKEDFDNKNGFKGISVHLVADHVPFKHVMVICNLIRYMYEWPEAYNIKQMLIAFQKDMFYSDFGQIFCLFESFIMNTHDQKVSFCDAKGASFIPAKTTKEMADALQDMDIQKQASDYLRFQSFRDEMQTILMKDCPQMWTYNKYNDYKSVEYLNKDSEELDESLIKNISKLYKFIIMNDCFAK